MRRAIVLVRFNRDAAQAERQAAIDRVNGEVVGGTGEEHGIEGYYYVRVEDDPDGQILCDAVRALNGLPQVRIASEDILLGER